MQKKNIRRYLEDTLEHLMKGRTCNNHATYNEGKIDLISDILDEFFPENETDAYLREQVDNWNQFFPKGTEMKITDEGAHKGEVVKTRSSAWIIGSNRPVVMLEGIPGAFSLNFLEPIK